MTVIRRLSIVCEVCPENDRSILSVVLKDDFRTVVLARKAARDKGWRRDKLGRDVCPRHPKLRGAR